MQYQQQPASNGGRGCLEACLACDKFPLCLSIPAVHVIHLPCNPYFNPTAMLHLQMHTLQGLEFPITWHLHPEVPPPVLVVGAYQEFKCFEGLKSQ